MLSICSTIELHHQPQTTLKAALDSHVDLLSLEEKKIPAVILWAKHLVFF